MSECPRRGQASLPALAIALLILSSVTVLSLAVAASADERHVASAVADRLVAADGPIAERRNVVDQDALAALDAETLRRELSVVDDEAVRITVGGSTVVSDRHAREGTTVSRIVTIRRVEERSMTPNLGPNKAVTLPRRTDELAIDLEPPAGTTIHTVRANDRVLLHNTSGLRGEYEVELSRFETARLEFAGIGPLREGNVTLVYPIERTHRETLGVTVDG